MTNQNNFCRWCGTSIDPSVTHCPYCGSPVKSASSLSPMGTAIQILAFVLAGLLGFASFALGISSCLNIDISVGLIYLFGGGLFTYAVTVLTLGFSRLVRNSDLILKELQNINKK